MSDRGTELVERVKDAYAAQESLQIVGKDSKSFMGRRTTAAIVSTAGHRGLI